MDLSSSLTMSGDLYEFWKTFKAIYPKAQLGDTFRSWAYQESLYRKGRIGDKIVDRSLVVTNARGGRSPHNFGLGFDVPNILSLDTIQNLNQNINTLLAFYPEITWGGNWKGSIYDPFHFQIKGWEQKVKNNPGLYLSFVRKLDEMSYNIYSKTIKPIEDKIENAKNTFKLSLLIGFTALIAYKSITK